MWHLRVVLVLGVAMGWTYGYYLFPGIFDPNPYIPKMSPDVLKVTSSQYRGPLITSYSGGGDVKNGEVGYVKSTSESGSGGYRHKENFHTKDGDDYEHERQEGYGESKGEELDHGSDGHKESERKNDETDDHSREEEEVEEDRNYEVTEEDNNDHQNPQQHTTYGVAPTKQPKKKIQPIPEFGTRLTLPKKTSHKKNHNGYETVIYHDNEQKGFEKGYDRRNGHNKPPTSVVVVNKGDDDDDEEDPREKEREHEEEERRDDYDDEKTDRDHQADQDREEYDENYNGYKYGNDFSKNYYDDEERDRENEDRRNERRGSARDEGPDYDEEVDKEQIDETANEDKYYGDEYDDDDYRRRQQQYEYASEADYDAQ